MKYCLLSFLVACAACDADPVTFRWDAPIDERITGYELHWGTESGQYTANVPVSGADTEVVQVEPEAGLWYFAVRAVGLDENSEPIASEYSNELFVPLGGPYQGLTPPPVDDNEYVLSAMRSESLITPYDHYRVRICWDGVCELSSEALDEKEVGAIAGKYFYVEFQPCNSNESDCGTSDGIQLLFPHEVINVESTITNSPSLPMLQ